MTDPSSIEQAQQAYKHWAPLIKYLEMEMTKLDYIPDTPKSIAADMRALEQGDHSLTYLNDLNEDVIFEVY